MSSTSNTQAPILQADVDAALVERAKAGDFAAFESLVGRYERRIFALALRVTGNRSDSEEVVQETFLSLVEHLGAFSGRSSFLTWLLRIATNHALLVLRKRKRKPTTSSTSLDADSESGELPHPQFIAKWKDDPAALAAAAETRQIINDALQSLDEKYRVVFVVRDIEGLSTEEAADVLGISVANAKVRLLRARLMLRERLTRAFGDEQRQYPHKHNSPDVTSEPVRHP